MIDWKINVYSIGARSKGDYQITDHEVRETIKFYIPRTTTGPTKQVNYSQTKHQHRMDHSLATEQKEVANASLKIPVFLSHM